MGWITGLAGIFSETELQKTKSLHSSSFYSFQTGNFYVAAGGIPETILGSISETDSSGWVVSGLGIKYENGVASFMNKNNWEMELSNKNFSQYKLNGHFAAVRRNENQVELFTDQLGIRKIYLAKINNCFAFSTRLDWLLKQIKNVTIDWEEFGSRWLLYNQISIKSFVKSVEILSQGGRAIINFDSLSLNVSNRPWHPDLVPSTNHTKNYISTLSDFTICGIENEKKLSLALSGGIDSRILLALLISSKSDNWGVHSFNFINHPDTKIAAEISKKLNLEHFFWEPSIPPADKIISLLSEYVGETALAAPVSKYLLLQFYSELNNQNKIVIDGAYGELARRRFLNSFLVKGKDAIYNNEVEKIIPLLKYSHSNIFKDDYVRLMQIGIRKQLNEVFNSMPSVKDFGIENWLDLFALRNRFVHSAVEQSRSDKSLVNYMPFGQPSFIKKVFETPVKERNNSKLFYKIIKDFSPTLAHIPFVKGDTTYPFGLGSITTSIWVKLKAKLGFSYKDDFLLKFLGTLSEYSQDTINSQDFISCEYYDHNKVKEIVEGYYRRNNFSLANDLNWWLTFELWRRNIQNK